MNLVFATDRGYLQHLAVALASLLENDNGISKSDWKKTAKAFNDYIALHDYDQKRSESGSTLVIKNKILMSDRNKFENLDDPLCVTKNVA